MNEYVYRYVIIKEGLELFIANNEKSRFNPAYYLYYPAKESVKASKAKLKAMIEANDHLMMTGSSNGVKVINE